MSVSRANLKLFSSMHSLQYINFPQYASTCFLRIDRKVSARCSGQRSACHAVCCKALSSTRNDCVTHLTKRRRRRVQHGRRELNVLSSEPQIRNFKLRSSDSEVKSPHVSPEYEANSISPEFRWFLIHSNSFRTTSEQTFSLFTTTTRLGNLFCILKFGKVLKAKNKFPLSARLREDHFGF